MLNAIFRPLEKWPGTPTPAASRKNSPFKSPYLKTLDLLEYELDQLAAHNIVIQAQVERSQLRNDGWLKSDAQMNALGRAIDEIFNGKDVPPEKKEWGFALLVFRFGQGDDHRSNYLSNANREDMIATMKEFIARAEGRYIDPTKKQ